MKQHDRGSVLHAKFSQDRHNSVSQYVKTIKAPEVPNIFDREILPFQKVVYMGHIKKFDDPLYSTVAAKCRT